MADLSPAARAVLDAVTLQMEGGWISPSFIPYECTKLAAALRAAADQVVPANGSRKNNEIRAGIYAIATELDSFHACL